LSLALTNAEVPVYISMNRKTFLTGKNYVCRVDSTLFTAVYVNETTVICSSFSVPANRMIKLFVAVSIPPVYADLSLPVDLYYASTTRLV
jgi:hypothetical protein